MVGREYLFLVTCFLFFDVQSVFLFELGQVKMLFCFFWSSFILARKRTIMGLRFFHRVFITASFIILQNSWVFNSSVRKNFFQLFWIKSVNKIVQNALVFVITPLISLELPLFKIIFLLKIGRTFCLQIFLALAQLLDQFSILAFGTWNR